jgi:hypothetical protein
MPLQTVRQVLGHQPRDLSAAPLEGKPMPYTYQKIEEQQGYRLLRRDDGRYCVLAVHHGHIYGAAPGDEPHGGGRWESSDTDAGISYVARGYPESYARQI